jgi:hypothetical protein
VPLRHYCSYFAFWTSKVVTSLNIGPLAEGRAPARPSRLDATLSWVVFCLRARAEGAPFVNLPSARGEETPAPFIARGPATLKGDASKRRHLHIGLVAHGPPRARSTCESPLAMRRRRQRTWPRRHTDAAPPRARAGPDLLLPPSPWLRAGVPRFFRGSFSSALFLAIFDG